MAIAKELETVHPNFIQSCPLCGRDNRIVMHGLWVLGKEVKQHPDMGYSFCNCRNIFYTRPENVTNPASYEPDEDEIIALPDPFFAWPNPYDFLLWDVRRYEIIWDMDEFIDELRSKSYLIEWAWRDMNVGSPTAQHYKIKVKRAERNIEV